jgi:hypothetical protein
MTGGSFLYISKAVVTNQPHRRPFHLAIMKHNTTHTNSNASARMTKKTTGRVQNVRPQVLFLIYVLTTAMTRHQEEGLPLLSHSFAFVSTPGDGATTRLLPSATLENEHTRSFSRAVFVCYHQTLENELTRSFSRLVVVWHPHHLSLPPTTLENDHHLHQLPPPSKSSTCAFS